MLFNSYIFLLLFLPTSVIGYFLLNRGKWYAMAEYFLLFMSLWFYAYFNVKYLPVILSSIILNYGVYKLLNHYNEPRFRKLCLSAGVLFNIGTIFYYKYYDFFITNVNRVFYTDFVLNHLILPLGISFFTFQQLSFLIDTYRKEVPAYSFQKYALFVTFFPQLIAGPIVTHDELVGQFSVMEKKRINWHNLSQGIFLFSLGLAKKVLVADTFGNAANWGFTNYTGLDTTNALITMVSYTFQIYFDFSGYSDMAIGIGKMFNIDLPLNFNSPYKSLTITEFWERWHMTLTRFFTRYVYIPLGGNRRGEARTYVNTMAVFLLSGLWHGADWTFVLWGAVHGVFVVVTRRFGKFFEQLHPALNWIITFMFVNITWVFFRAGSVREALVILKNIALLNFGSIHSSLIECFNLDELSFLISRIPGGSYITAYHLVFNAFFTGSLIILLGGKNNYDRMLSFRPTIINSLICVILLTWSILSFSGISTFLYFNF